MAATTAEANQGRCSCRWLAARCGSRRVKRASKDPAGACERRGCVGGQTGSPCVRVSVCLVHARAHRGDTVLEADTAPFRGGSKVALSNSTGGAAAAGCAAHGGAGSGGGGSGAGRDAAQDGTTGRPMARRLPRRPLWLRRRLVLTMRRRRGASSSSCC